MKYDFDVLVIGLGPAGMAVSIMASEMGLKVCAVEAHKIGGECMNVGCIPSKALLRMAKARHAFAKLSVMELASVGEPEVLRPFERIAHDLEHINKNKTLSMFDKVELVLGQGRARFVDSHTVEVGDRKLSAQRIFIAVGTKPAIPAFPGIENVECLTNENMFHLERVPESMVVLGGGAIACEMAQAFSRLGCKCTVIIRGLHLIWREDEDAFLLLEKEFQKEGIEILSEQKPVKVANENSSVVVETDKGQTVKAKKLLVAAGRKMDYQELGLKNAGVRYSEKGIEVNDSLETTAKGIYAVGDCNGYVQFSHAAMHQGMLALMNCMLPRPVKRKFKKYLVPWTIFTEPQISHVGPRESELKVKGVKYEVVRVSYEDYGAAIAEKVDTGFVKVFVSPAGRIYAATVVGEGSADMINEWGLAIQKRIRMHEIMFLQHSFPSMAFLNKRASETWMMNRMKSPMLRAAARVFYRL